MLRNNNKLTMYEEIKGAFDWNRTHMVSLSNNGMVYSTPNMRNMLAPHCDEAYTVSCVINHRQLLKCYVPATRGQRISGTYRLDPSHWMLPVVSKQDKTVITVANLLKAFQKFIYTSFADK